MLLWPFLTLEEGLRFSLPAFDLVGLDFCFIAAALVGIYALHRLSLVVEQGEVEREVIASQRIFGSGKRQPPQEDDDG